MHYALIPDGPLDNRVLSASPIITVRTARHLVHQLTEPTPNGLRRFAATGVLTPEFFTDLTNLYDLRQPEVDQWLDALTRFAVQPAWIPTTAHGHRPAADGQ